MSKSVEQMAEEYSFDYMLLDDPRYAMSITKKAFLAGYQAAKDEYKVAIDTYNDVAKQMMEEAVRIMSPKDELADASKVMGELSRAFDQGYQSAKAHYQTDWISVKERLPEEGQRVLLYNSLKYVSIVMAHWYSSSRYPFFDHVTIDDIHINFPLEDNKHLYWMPLPEAPKEEK